MGRQEALIPPLVLVTGDSVCLPKLAFRVEELTHVLGLGETKIRELIDKGKLGSIREGSAVLVTYEQVAAYLKRKQLCAASS